jgi:hypothetical protein
MFSVFRKQLCAECEPIYMHNSATQRDGKDSPVLDDYVDIDQPARYPRERKGLLKFGKSRGQNEFRRLRGRHRYLPTGVAGTDVGNSVIECRFNIRNSALCRVESETTADVYNGVRRPHQAAVLHPHVVDRACLSGHHHSEAIAATANPQKPLSDGWAEYPKNIGYTPLR